MPHPVYLHPGFFHC